jgi:hypothetical protein
VSPATCAGDEAGKDDAQHYGLAVRHGEIRGRLDGMAETVTEVEESTATTVELVFLDELLLDEQRGSHGVAHCRLLAAAEGCHVCLEVCHCLGSGRDVQLDDLAEAAEEVVVVECGY